MEVVDFIHCLYLKNYFFFDDKIQSLRSKQHPVILDLYDLFPSKSNAVLVQLVCEGLCVDFFNKPRPENSMHIDCTPDDAI